MIPAPGANGGVAGGEDPVRKGLSIAREADQRDRGFGDYAADVEMTLENRNKTVSSRRLHIKVLEVADDGDKSLILFSRPRDINGTALLTFSHKVGNDDQWIYLPALKRVKRISSTNKSGPFVGSEFAYEDLISAEVEKYAYRWLRDGVIDETPAFVVERVPIYRNSGYSRQLVWYDAAEFRILRIEYFDRKNELLKIYSAGDYKKYNEKHWRAGVMEMENVQTGKTTRLAWKKYRFGTGFRGNVFDKNRLRNLR